MGIWYKICVSCNEKKKVSSKLQANDLIDANGDQKGSLIAIVQRSITPQRKQLFQSGFTIAFFLSRTLIWYIICLYCGKEIGNSVV